MKYTFVLRMLRTTAALAVVSGCGSVADNSSGETTSRAAPALVGGSSSGAIAVTPFTGNASTSQLPTSESAPVFNNEGALVVAFNYDSFDSDVNNLFCPGNSLTGYSYSTNGAGAPVAGFDGPFHINPPPGAVRGVSAGSWSMLWGDPAITMWPGTDDLYISSLAVPGSKMPPNGQCYGYPDGNGHLPPNTVALPTDPSQYLGGMCVARSQDGGRTFSVSSGDCLADNNDFFDGTSMAATGSGVFAATRDVTTNQIRVWMATSPTGSFVEQANPFPGKVMISHPVMVPLANGAGVAVLAAEQQAGGSNANLWLQEYVTRGTSQASLFFSPPIEVATDHFAQDIALHDGRTIRNDTAGQQFDMVDVWPQFSGTDILTIVYTTSSTTNGLHTSLKSVACRLNEFPAACFANGSYDLGADVFSPAVAAAWVPTGQTRGVTATAFVKVSWMRRLTQVNPELGTTRVLDNFELFSANGNLSNVRNELHGGSQIPCPTPVLDPPGFNYSSGGYWGDYDLHMAVYQSGTSQAGFYRTFSDSTDNNGVSQCFVQNVSGYTNPLNVSAAFIGAN